MATSGAIVLNWTNRNIKEIEGTNIYKSQSDININNLPAPLTFIEGNAETYVDYDLVYNNQYYYAIEVVGKDESKVTPKVLMRYARPSPIWWLLGDNMYISDEYGNAREVYNDLFPSETRTVKLAKDQSYLIAADRRNLKKIDDKGKLLWSKRIFRSYEDQEDIREIDEDEDGNIYVLVNSDARYDETVLKYDPNGEYLWRNRDMNDALCMCYMNGYLYIGSRYDGDLRKVDASDGTYISVEGLPYYTRTLTVFNDNMYIGVSNGSLRKYDKDGNLLWVSNTDISDHVVDVFVYRNIVYAVAGNRGIARFANTDGTFIDWFYEYETSQNSRSIVMDKYNRFLVGTDRNALVISENGDLLFDYNSIANDNNLFIKTEPGDPNLGGLTPPLREFSEYTSEYTIETSIVYEDINYLYPPRNIFSDYTSSFTVNTSPEFDTSLYKPRQEFSDYTSDFTVNTDIGFETSLYRPRQEFVEYFSDFTINNTTYTE